MRKLKLLFAACALWLGVGQTWAQTDVTSTYLTNADFATNPAINAEGTAVSEASSDNTITPTGWTDNSSGDWPRYGVLPFGYSGTQYGFMNSTNPPASDDDHTGYTLAMSGSWGSTPLIYQTSSAALPVGYYELTVEVYNNSTITNALQGNKIAVYSDVAMTTALASATTTVYPSKSWKKETLSFTLTEAQNVTFALGIYGNGGGAGSNQKLFLANLKLTWTDPLLASRNALQEEIDKASLCAAKEGLADAISAAENVLATATTVAELEEALAILQAADRDAVLRYENGLADATYATPVATNFVVNGTFDSNINGWSRSGDYFQNNQRQTGKESPFSGGFYENWTPKADNMLNKMYQTIQNIPNGTYRLDIAAFVNILADPNESQYVFANNDKTYLTAGDPTAYEVYTVVTTNQIEIGLEQTTSTANWMAIDNVSLRYYGAGDVVAAAQNASHKLAWEEAKAAAETAIANTDYVNVTGKERSDLETEIAKAEPTTAQGYDDAAAALTTATQSFVNAKTNYDIYAANIVDLVYADPTKKPVVTNETTAATIITALRAYFESHALAEGVDGVVDMTSRIANPNAENGNNGWTWTGNKNNPASNEPWTDADGTNTHSYFDGGNWNGSNWTTTMEQTISLPAGRFLLTAKGRAATNTTLTMTVGENSVELPHVGNTGNVFDRGWGDGSVEFVTDGSDVVIKVTASAEPTHEWFSISDFRLVRLEIFTELATAADYEAMAAALATAKSMTLGFDVDEYAPYNNVEAIKAIAAAEAIDTEAENAKADIEAITTALGNWTANDEEVNAVYNGNFALSIATETSGVDVDVPGWTANNAIRQVIEDGVNGTFPALEETTGGKALFTWSTNAVYGETEGYTLPLPAHTLYEITFKHAGWNGANNSFSVSVLNSDGEGLAEQQCGKSYAGPQSAGCWNTFKAIFETGEAGNYVLKMMPSGNSTFTDITIFKAQPVSIAISDAGYATYCSDVALDFVDTGLIPYAATISGSDVIFNPIETGRVPAGVGILIGGIGEDGKAPADTYEVRVVAEADEVESALIGVTEDTEVEAPIYVLMKVNDDAGFCLTKNTFTVKANTAYLPYFGEGARFIGINGSTNGIAEIENMRNLENESVYNLNGQRMSKPTKGLYIVNGKKITIK